MGNRFRKKVNIRTLLQNHLTQYFHSAKIITHFAGSIPCGYKRNDIAIPGLIKAGDAANTINPVSRAGISEALHSGAIAGRCALKMLEYPQYKKQYNICRDYEKLWYKKLGHKHLKLAKVKNSLYKVPDEDYNRAAQLLKSLSKEQITMSRIFKTSLGRFPRLVWALRHLM